VARASGGKNTEKKKPEVEKSLSGRKWECLQWCGQVTGFKLESWNRSCLAGVLSGAAWAGLQGARGSMEVELV